MYTPCTIDNSKASFVVSNASFLPNETWNGFGTVDQRPTHQFFLMSSGGFNFTSLLPPPQAEIAFELSINTQNSPTNRN